MRIPRPLAYGTLLLGVAACSKVPYTDRRQFNLLPDDLMVGLGKMSYVSSLEGETLEKGTADTKTVKQIGQAIATASGEDYDWEFKLIDDDETINAWCLPGGKVAVYSGLLPIVEHEAGLSFVLGHEVGHALAHHGAERLSQQAAALGGLAGLWLYLDRKTELSGEQQAILLAALGVGAQVGVLLPFSRTHEKEADVIGLMTMAAAGYPPEQSLGVWTRMGEASSSEVPTFLSTHPSSDQRKANLREWMEQAQKRYDRNKGKVSGDSTTQRW